MLVSEIIKDKITDEVVDRILFTGFMDDGRNADCIVVLESIKASQYRVPAAVEEYKKGRAPKILFSGGKVRDYPEGRMSEATHMRKNAINLGVKPEDIIVDEYSQNTVENILGTMMELQRSFWINRVKRVLLVTTSYHMRRSLMLARYLFPKHIEVIPCPADDANTRRDNWMKNDEGRNRAVNEVNNIIECVENGLIPDFEI